MWGAKCEWDFCVCLRIACAQCSVFCHFFQFPSGETILGEIPSYFPICHFELKLELLTLHESIQTKPCATRANGWNVFIYSTNVVYVVKSCFPRTNMASMKTMPEKLCHHSLITASNRVTFLFCSFRRKKNLLLSHLVGCWMPCKCPFWMHFELIVYVRAEMNECKESAPKYTVLILGARWTLYIVWSPLHNINKKKTLFRLLCSFVWNK